MLTKLCLLLSSASFSSLTPNGCQGRFSCRVMWSNEPQLFVRPESDLHKHLTRTIGPEMDYYIVSAGTRQIQVRDVSNGPCGEPSRKGDSTGRQRRSRAAWPAVSRWNLRSSFPDDGRREPCVGLRWHLLIQSSRCSNPVCNDAGPGLRDRRLSGHEMPGRRLISMGR